MNKKAVFQILKKQKKQTLLDTLEQSWERMSTQQRQNVFDGFIQEAQSTISVNAEDVRAAVRQFEKDSFAGLYYAPFDINSKNFMDVPEETGAWFAKLDELFAECVKLVKQKEYQVAVETFDRLYELTGCLWDDEIVFADELGMWMFPGDEKTYCKAYIRAASKACVPEDFQEKALFRIIDDAHRSCCNKIYSLVKSVATPEQMALVDREVQKRRLKTV